MVSKEIQIAEISLKQVQRSIVADNRAKVNHKVHEHYRKNEDMARQYKVKQAYESEQNHERSLQNIRKLEEDEITMLEQL